MPQGQQQCSPANRTAQNPVQSGNIPVDETYWSLVAKADKKFSKIRDLPYYQRTRYETYFYKVFKVYTKLWKFQQENRQRLVEAGVQRWEIGEIASRIAQLYFGQYMRTSEASYLLESYVLNEAILTREYFKDEQHQDVSLAKKQLRFISRFLTVCLLLNRREMICQLVDQLKTLLDECKRTFQETDFKEWMLVIQEIAQFLKVDTDFMNIRPLRYSIKLDNPNQLPRVKNAKRRLRLRDALLCSYHPTEVKFSELTLDTFRMLQSLEWEPRGQFYPGSLAPASGTGSGGSQNGPTGANRLTRDIADPSLPPNVRKTILFRPTVTHFMAVLGTACEELPSGGILLLYLSASGNSARAMPSQSRAGSSMTANSDSSPAHSITSGYEKTDQSGDTDDCLFIGPRGHGGMNCIYPSDLLPFTRRPLLLIIDSESSKSFKAMSGAEKGERVAMLLSQAISLPFPAANASHHPTGSLFTCFLTAPLQSFVILVGFTGSDIKDLYGKAEVLFQSSINKLGSSLADADNLDPVWGQLLPDPLLRRLVLRFVFCRAVLSLHRPFFSRTEYVPESMPCLPDVASPTSPVCQELVWHLAELFRATDKFVFSEATIDSMAE